MTDLEIHLTLARFMGFEELPPSAQTAAFRRACRRCYQDGTRAFLQEEGRLGMLGGGFWEPLANPAQSGEVMAEVARRGGRVETACQYGMPSFATAHAYLRRPDDAHPAWRMSSGSEAAEDDNPAAAWCRAVCCAIVAAIQNAQKPPGETT